MTECTDDAVEPLLRTILPPLVALYIFYQGRYAMKLMLEFLFISVPKVTVQLPPKPSSENPIVSGPKGKRGKVICYDKATFQQLSEVADMTKYEVDDLCMKAKMAQKKWAQTSFQERRRVLRTLQKYVVANMEVICEVRIQKITMPNSCCLCQ